MMKDFVHVAGPLGITHFIIFSQTKIGSYMVSEHKFVIFLHARTFNDQHCFKFIF